MCQFFLNSCDIIVLIQLIGRLKCTHSKAFQVQQSKEKQESFDLPTGAGHVQKTFWKVIFHVIDVSS